MNESDMNGTYVGMYLYMQFTISPGLLLCTSVMIDDAT